MLPNLASFADELEKISRVRGLVKEYRRALQMLTRDPHIFHSTGRAGAGGILKDKMLRTGSANFYGKGVYFGSKPTGHGPYTFARPRSKVPDYKTSLKEREGWGFIPTETGTALQKGDTFIAKSIGPGQKKLIQSARERGLRTIRPEAYQKAMVKAAPGGVW